MTGELVNRKLSSVQLIRHLHKSVYRVEVFRVTYVYSIFCHIMISQRFFIDPAIPFGSLDS